MKSLIRGSGLRGLWRLILTGAGVGCLAGISGCIVVQDKPPVTYEPPPPAPEPQVVVDQPVYTPPPPEVVTVYEQDLSPYGHWVQISAYGRCWVYDRRPYGWRPYTIGHWVSTDDGLCWVSEGDETAWGPTCYHYGRWYEDSSYGWAWVPGSVWGPSWCAWREGNGYSAWAPLPPECGDGRPVDVVIVDRYVPRDRYVVVETRYVGEPRIHEHFEQNNVTIINRTTNITNVTYVNNRVVNRGVPVEHIQQAGGRNVEVMKVERASDPAEARRLVAEGKPVQYAPPAIETYRNTHPFVIKAAPAHPRAEVQKPVPQYHPPENGTNEPQVRPRPVPKPQPQVERPPTPEEPRNTRRMPPNTVNKTPGEPRNAEPGDAGRSAEKARPEPREKPEPKVMPEPKEKPQPKAKPEQKVKPKPGEKPEDAKDQR